MLRAPRVIRQLVFKDLIKKCLEGVNFGDHLRLVRGMGSKTDFTVKGGNSL